VQDLVRYWDNSEHINGACKKQILMMGRTEFADRHYQSWQVTSECLLLV
jgi:hypothetical protein